MYYREILPFESEFNQGLGKLRPWLKFRPLGTDIFILHGHSWWTVIFSHTLYQPVERMKNEQPHIKK